MAYFGWVTTKSATGDTRTYLCVRARTGKVLEWLGRNPTPAAIRAAAERHDVTVTRSTKKED